MFGKQGNPRRGTLAGARPPSRLTPTGRTHSHRPPRVLEAALGAKGAPLCAPSQRLAFCPVQHRHNRPNPKLNASLPLALPQRAPESEAHTGQKQCGWVFLTSKEAKHPLSLAPPANPPARHESLVKVASDDVLESAVYFALLFLTWVKVLTNHDKAP